MPQSRLDTRCARSGGGGCCSYWPGHQVHFIQARRIGESPWGWRDAVVVVVDGQFLTLRYLAEDVEFVVWHHARLPVQSGDLVRVNQGAGTVLQGRFGQVAIAHDSPLHAVPAPEHPELWAVEVSVGVVDLATGRAINTNGEFGGPVLPNS